MNGALHRSSLDWCGASSFLRPNLKMLDAGCGTGAATLALHAALAKRDWQPAHVDAFDLTRSM